MEIVFRMPKKNNLKIWRIYLLFSSGIFLLFYIIVNNLFIVDFCHSQLLFQFAMSSNASCVDKTHTAACLYPVSNSSCFLIRYKVIIYFYPTSLVIQDILS